MDADQVAPNLWVGAAPESGVELRGFDVVVFAATENQPRWIPDYDGLVIRCGFDDDVLTEAEASKATNCAKLVARHLFNGKRVLVTCMSGLNRSSLVAAMALLRATPMTSLEIVDRIRAARGDWALSNETFVDFLERQRPF